MDDGAPTSEERLGRNEVGRALKAAGLGCLLGTVLVLLARSPSHRG